MTCLQYSKLCDVYDSILQVYVEDGLGDRVWVDIPGCQLFAANVCTVFNTLNKPDDELFVLDETDPLHPAMSGIDVQPRYSFV